MLKTIGDFEKVPLGARLYFPEPGNPKYFYYAGLSPYPREPVNGRHIILINSGNVALSSTMWVSFPEGIKTPCVTDYEEACEISFHLLVKKMELFDRIYFNGGKGIKELLEKYL